MKNICIIAMLIISGIFANCFTQQNIIDEGQNQNTTVENVVEENVNEIENTEVVQVIETEVEENKVDEVIEQPKVVAEEQKQEKIQENSKNKTTVTKSESNKPKQDTTKTTNSSTSQTQKSEETQSKKQTVQSTQPTTQQNQSEWCIDGGKTHLAGDGENEHGYYSSWEEAFSAYEEYTKSWTSSHYKINQCPCGKYYFWAIQD